MLSFQKHANPDEPNENIGAKLAFHLRKGIIKIADRTRHIKAITRDCSQSVQIKISFQSPTFALLDSQTRTQICHCVAWNENIRHFKSWQPLWRTATEHPKAWCCRDHHRWQFSRCLSGISSRSDWSHSILKQLHHQDSDWSHFSRLANFPQTEN